MQITLQQNHCTGKEMKDLYPRLIDAIDSYGHCYVPRDLRCIEIRPYHFTLFNPLQSIYGGDDRRLSLKFFVVETLGYLGGLQSKWYMDLLCRIQPKYEKFRSNMVDSQEHTDLHSKSLSLTLCRCLDPIDTQDRQLHLSGNQALTAC